MARLIVRDAGGPGMTLAELAEFVQEAYRLDIAPASRVHADVNPWSGKIKKITVKEES
jgi:hypothetical protein